MCLLYFSLEKYKHFDFTIMYNVPLFQRLKQHDHFNMKAELNIIKRKYISKFGVSFSVGWLQLLHLIMVQ